MKMNYRKSVELALLLGYKEVLDETAYREKYFIKDRKIWIHDKKALKLKLQVTSDIELNNLGYDVDNYNKYKKYTNEMADQEMRNLYTSITHSEGKATYLHDGMWLLSDGTMEER